MTATKQQIKGLIDFLKTKLMELEEKDSYLRTPEEEQIVETLYEEIEAMEVHLQCDYTYIEIKSTKIYIVNN